MVSAGSKFPSAFQKINMEKNQQEATRIFSKNRAEDLGSDVWEYFVIPLWYDRILDLTQTRKPSVILGGRGCGKTMLLRFLSHNSTFSRKRTSIPFEAIQQIGLYWKVDTQFANAMHAREIPDHIWVSAFGHFAAIMLGIELLNSLESIGRSSHESFEISDLDSIDFSSLQNFDSKIPISHIELKNYLESESVRFQTWINNVDLSAKPVFFPNPLFLNEICKCVKKHFANFHSAAFFIFIDEFENLRSYQKRIINTWLKHNEFPIIFNLASKKHGFDERQTLSDETLSEVHDFRQHDLDEYLWDEKDKGVFYTFAAEILVHMLSVSKLIDTEIDIEILRNPDQIEKRKTADYRHFITSKVQSYFPDVPEKDLAGYVFEEPALMKRLKERIKSALNYRGSSISESKFLLDDQKQVSIVSPALIYRDRLPIEAILEQIEKHKNNEENKFSKEGGWIENMFIDCLLQIYKPYSRTAPFYAGFKTFCHLSRGNLRHFLELCHKALHRAQIQNTTISFPLDPILQADGARQASANLLKEIRSFGKFGNQLHSFVLRLGSIFEFARHRSEKGASEVARFSIDRGEEKLSDEDIDFINEASKYSVLIEGKSTETQGGDERENYEYQLNPIYAPYFQISYRKKRRISLSTNDMIVLIRGRLSDFNSLVNRFKKRWIKDEKDVETLFSSIKD